MRDWFIVGCKLLGVYFLYLALASALSSIGFLVSASQGTFVGTSKKEIMVTSAIGIISEIACAIPLLFKTEWIADSLKLSGRLHTAPNHHGADTLQSGITLLGIYVFCTKLGGLVKVFALSRETVDMGTPFAATQPASLRFSADFIEPGITILISLCLIFGSKYITAFLTRREQSETEQAAPLDGE